MMSVACVWHPPRPELVHGRHRRHAGVPCSQSTAQAHILSVTPGYVLTPLLRERAPGAVVAAAAGFALIPRRLPVHAAGEWPPAPRPR